ncbi:MAG: hypothetical protein ABW189_05495 [Rickettsiales bacterium]
MQHVILGPDHAKPLREMVKESGDEIYYPFFTTEEIPPFIEEAIAVSSSTGLFVPTDLGRSMGCMPQGKLWTGSFDEQNVSDMLVHSVAEAVVDMEIEAKHFIFPPPASDCSKLWIPAALEFNLLVAPKKRGKGLGNWQAGIGTELARKFNALAIDRVVAVNLISLAALTKQRGFFIACYHMQRPGKDDVPALLLAADVNGIYNVDVNGNNTPALPFRLTDLPKNILALMEAEAVKTDVNWTDYLASRKDDFLAFLRNYPGMNPEFIRDDVYEAPLEEFQAEILSKVRRNA